MAGEGLVEIIRHKAIDALEQFLIYLALRCCHRFLSHIASGLRQVEARLVHGVVRGDFFGGKGAGVETDRIK